MRSISSPVPTGTVDLVTTTAVGRQKRRDLAHRLIDEAQIGMAVAAARRRADRDEHRLGLGDARGLAGEFEPALPHIGLDQIGEPRLEDRDFAAIERRDLAGILVDAGDLMAEIGKAGAGNEPDIAGADHGHAHSHSPFTGCLVSGCPVQDGPVNLPSLVERWRRRNARAPAASTTSQRRPNSTTTSPP